MYGLMRKALFSSAARNLQTAPGLTPLRIALRSLGRPVERAGEALRWLATEIPTLTADREVESAWIAAKLPAGPGRALDFGSGSSNLGLIAAQKGFDVMAVDLLPVAWFYQHPRLQFCQGDVFNLDLKDESFDVVINCSSIEHVGLSGRYTVSVADPEGDLRAARLFYRLLKPGGTMLLTVPVGRDSLFPPLHRVYGQVRLPRLIEGWQMQEEQYWAKNGGNRWSLVGRDAALNFEPGQRIYALGLFVLRKGSDGCR